ncbi:unnamed protein product [marine sediment metagenome]|uniref:Uncharacterized protein n=1 Tax=marine sediment metagenome TaxID=412755 RepID=X1TMX2_9ZZZZ
MTNMVTTKNIRIKMKNGKTRLQRVQVLASGKYKFIKNLKKSGSSRGAPSKKTSKKGKTTANNKGGKGILGSYGAIGLVEDLGIGYIGAQALMGMGYPLESALPMTRLVQGVAGKALNRRGKGRLQYAVLDLIDVYLIRKGINLSQGISLKAWM